MRKTCKMNLILQGLFLLGLTQAKPQCPVFPTYQDGAYYNISLLGVAAVKNDVDVVDGLVGSGCDINDAGAATANYYEDIPATAGATPLHIAALEGSAEFVAKLLTLPGIEESLNARDDFGVTPVYYAASWGRAEIVETLATAGADVDIPDNAGFTPVNFAACYGYIETVKTLARLGADLEAGGEEWGDTPLISAGYYGYREVAEFLVKEGVKVNKKDRYGYTALYWTTWSNYRHIVQFLKQNGARM